MAFAAVGLSTHIMNNNLKSALLLLGFPVLLLLMVLAFFTGLLLVDESQGMAFAEAVSHGFEQTRLYWYFPVGFALGWFTIAWFAHTRLIQAATGAIPVTRKEFPELYNLLENLCISRGLPMPKFQVIDSPALNAFASGINEKTYCITLTRGIIESLDQDELEAVIAHELTHIMNRDVRLLIVSVIFVGMISFLAEMAFRSMMYGGGRHSRYRSRSGNRDNNNGAVMLVALAVLILGYVFAVLLRFALSRKREYLADAGAVELTKNPDAMMRALMRISGQDKVEDMPDEVQQMCIENSANFMGLFATHPPIKDRIKVISDMTGTPVPTLPVTLKRPPRRPWKGDRPPERSPWSADPVNANLNDDYKAHAGDGDAPAKADPAKGPWGE